MYQDSIKGKVGPKCQGEIFMILWWDKVREQGLYELCPINYPSSLSGFGLREPDSIVSYVENI